jgi:3-oxoacyl-[acyl-carrier-protein] synthase III
MVAADFVLDVIAQGAWNGGTVVDNSIYENAGMAFKGGIPVTRATIEERIGVRTRMVAPLDERIGVLALQNLLDTSGIDPARIRVLIAATNVGEDKFDPGPASRYPYDLIRQICPGALVLDLYAGCPGFNASVETIYMLALSGRLQAGDLAVVVGAENIHRAQAFKPLDTATIIFGDDALATALEIGRCAGSSAPGRVCAEETLDAGEDFIPAIATALLPWAREGRLDGIILDNQLGKIEHRVPATAARVQHALMQRLFPKEAETDAFRNFRTAFEIYESYGAGFGYDLMSADADPRTVQSIAGAYTASGRYRRLAAVFLRKGQPVRLSLVEGAATAQVSPARGVVDTLTRSHGCFAGFIEARFDGGDVFGAMDGKGVFLYATRGAKSHLKALLAANRIEFKDIDLLIEHQANFAMLPLTLEQVLSEGGSTGHDEVARFLSERMVVNIHERGNCSVVCMQRLPYDLARGALKPDTIQGFAVNRNLERLREARTILYDSVGAGMTRSSFLLKKESIWSEHEGIDVSADVRSAADDRKGHWADGA